MTGAKLRQKPPPKGSKTSFASSGAPAFETSGMRAERLANTADERFADLHAGLFRDDDRDWLLDCLRQEALDTKRRLTAALEFTRYIILGAGDARNDVMDLKAEMARVRHLFGQEPSLALDLAETCEDASEVSLKPLAELIFGELEKVALEDPRSACERNDLYYLLVDLAKRRERLGQHDVAQLLWDIVHAAPGHMRDPRLQGRHMAWRFNSEPAPPDDKFRVRGKYSLLDRDLEVPFCRPLPFPQRRCSCSIRPIAQYSSVSCFAGCSGSAFHGLSGSATMMLEGSDSLIAACKEVDQHHELGAGLDSLVARKASKGSKGSKGSKESKSSSTCQHPEFVWPRRKPGIRLKIVVVEDKEEEPSEIQQDDFDLLESSSGLGSDASSSTNTP